MMLDTLQFSPTSSASPTSPGALTIKSAKSSKLSAARPKNAGKNRRKTDDGWDTSLTDAGQPSSPEAPRAKILYVPNHEAWLYGLHLCMEKELPPFPELDASDMPVMQPLPHDNDLMTTGPAQGLTYVVIASSLDWEPFCCEVLGKALRNEPMTPEVYRFAFYLYSRAVLVRSAAVRWMKSAAGPEELRSKRPQDNSSMQADRCLFVPIQGSQDPRDVSVQQCDVMMVGLGDSIDQDPEDPPGLAILDSGCTRTMHGTSWAADFEKALSSKGLQPLCKSKTQRFKGVGGETISQVVKVFPIGLGGTHGELHSAETEGDTPLLMSRPFMQKLGAIIDLQRGVVSFEEIGVKDLPLIRTKRGHLAVDLLDYDNNQLDTFQSFYNEFEPSDTSPGSESRLLVEETSGQLSREPMDGRTTPASAMDARGAPLLAPDCRMTPVSKMDTRGAPLRDGPAEQGDRGQPAEPYPGWEPDPDIDRPTNMPPDDWYEEQDALWHLKREAEGCEEVLEEIRLDRERRRQQQGLCCEDPEVFENLLADGFFTIRKTTAKKGKKLDAMNRVLDSKDMMIERHLTGGINPKAARRPPTGKRWLKQIFAGQMGLTILAILYGMNVGIPLDSSSSSWDATDKQAMKRVHQDMQSEDPYCTVLTHPCGPWGNWSNFNLARGGPAALTVQQLREDQRPILKMVNRVVVDRLKADRHVFVEQPYGSESINEPEMSDVRKYIEEGRLICLKVDGCQLGYRDSESRLPHKKPSMYITSMVAAESVFQNTTCNCSKHEPLEGNNKYGSRTKQAAEWPALLNQKVLECILQQAQVEHEVYEQAMLVADEEAFPVRPLEVATASASKRRRRSGRVSALSPNFAAPPVYVRADARGEPIAIGDGTELPDGDDDHGHRAQQAQDLDPVLNQSEGQRRYEWLQVDPTLRKTLRDLHVNFGHPTAATLQRILRRQNAKPEVIRAAGLMSCDSCGESIRRRRPRPVRLPNKYEFNRHLLIDTFFSHDVRGVTFGFLNIIDDATGFQVVSCLGELQGPPGSRVALRHFTTAWSSWAGLPHSLQVDRGKEFMAVFADQLKAFGVEQEVMPLEAPWKGGKAEKAGHLWKELWKKVVQESQINGLDDVLIATGIITQTRNSFPRSNGYSPVQWVLGVPDLRFPASLLNEDAPNLEVHEACEDPRSFMARSLSIRESAKIAQVRLDTDARVRRALLHQSTPTRGPYPIGAYVYFYKTQVQPGASRQYRWFGPGRVIGVEMRNPRRLEDEDPPTEGGSPHSYWIRYGPSVVLATGEQMRFASEDELLAAHTVPHYVVDGGSARGARSFIDVRPLGALPAIPPPEQPDERMDETPTLRSAPVALAPIPEAGEEAEEPTPMVVPSDSAPLPDVNLDVLPEPPVPVLEIPDEELAPDDDVTRALSMQEPEPQPATASTQLEAAMRDPSRLDGYGRAPRPERLPTSWPYYAEQPWPEAIGDLYDNVQKLRQCNLAGILGAEAEESSEEEEEEPDGNPKFAYLTGRAVRSEINLKELSPENRRLFDASMQKEWSSWQKFQAVEELTEEEIASLPPDTKVIGTRWVHTDKNSKPRAIAYHMAKKTGKSKEQVDKEFPFEAKSRCVVQGCQEDDHGIRSDSPTASLLAFNLVCAIATMMSWTLAAYDASTAYLQAKGIARLLVLRAPHPPPPGVNPGTLFRAKGSIYGTKDAGRSWWKKLAADAKSVGWIMSAIEAALFFLYDGEGSLVGVMASHVDDLITCGAGPIYEGAMSKLSKMIYLKEKKEEFRFCGKNVVQANGTVTIEQVDAIETLEYQVLEKNRRKDVNSLLTEAEKTDFRALIGSMGWISRQTRPDVMVNVSMASQTLGRPRIRDVVELNKAVKMLKESADEKWRFVPSELNLNNSIIFVCADSSFANVEGTKSQCGYVVGLSLPTIKDGQPTPVMILETTSSSIKRVCRSTLAAESNAFLMAVESADYISSIFREMMNPGISLRDLELNYFKKPVIAFTDAKSLEATITKEAGLPSDKRVKLLVAQIKEFLGEGCEVVWVDTSQMIADVLTKIGCERSLLIEALYSGKWQLMPTEQAIRNKEAIREGRHRRKAQKRAAAATAPSTEDGCEISPCAAA